MALLGFATPLHAQSGADEIEYLLQQGRQALAEGQAQQAALTFESVLLSQPWRLGVWMDYALALQQSGDAESARAIFQSLRQKNPPDYLRVWLDQQLQSEQSGAWRYGGELSVQTGRDSNLNRAPTANELTLTLPAGAVSLPLSAASRASAGAAQLVRLEWRAEHNEWLIQTLFDARFGPTGQGQDYLYSSVGVVKRWHGAHDYQLALTGQNLQYGGLDVQNIVRAGFYQTRVRQEEGRNCELTYGTELERVNYPATPLINGNYLGMVTGYGCQQGVAWQALLRAGMDMAEHQRPGGDQPRIVATGQFGGRLGADIWRLQAEVSWLQDVQGYSSLLSNNARRTIQRNTLKLYYQHPLTNRLQATLSGEIFNQRSNLGLFDTSGKAVWMGLSHAFN